MQGTVSIEQRRSSTSHVSVKLQKILRHQQEDIELLVAVQHNNSYIVKDFTSASQVRKLICLNNKIFMPKKLQKNIVQWYHMQLCHPDETSKEQSANIFHGRTK